MIRPLPQSLFGQTVLILLAGLIVSHTVGSWIYTADREQAVRAVGGFATAQRIANLSRLVQDTPREARQRIVAALSDQSFRVSLSAHAPAMPAVEDDDGPHRLLAIRRVNPGADCMRHDEAGEQDEHCLAE